MRALIAAVAAVILVFILLQSGVISALLMFVMVGAIPSTTWVFSPTTMLAIVLIISWLTILHATVISIQAYHRHKKATMSAASNRPASRQQLA